MAIHVRVSGSCHIDSHRYSTIWVNSNPTCLLNGSGFFNPNTTYLLNGLVVLTCLSDFIKMKKKEKTNFSINQIGMNYEKPNK